jgi:undecaprenyl pyrophosphate phosphatase UppP
MVPDAMGASPALLSSVAIGCAGALVSGVAAIWLFVQMLRRRTFHYFAWYAWAVGAAFLVWLHVAR